MQDLFSVRPVPTPNRGAAVAAPAPAGHRSGTRLYRFDWLDASGTVVRTRLTFDVSHFDRYVAEVRRRGVEVDFACPFSASACARS